MKPVVVVVGLLSAAATCFSQAAKRPSVGPIGREAAAPAAPKKVARADLTSTLERVLAVAGSADFNLKTKDTSIPGATWRSTDTWGEWNFDISLTNQTGLPLTLDSTTFIVETDTMDTTYHGYMIVREPRIRKIFIPPVTVQQESTTEGVTKTREYVDHSAGYGLDNYSAFDAQVRIINFGGNAAGKFYSGAAADFHRGKYGTLVKGQTIHFKDTVMPYRWLEGENRKTVCFVLPEVHQGTSQDLDSYQPIALLRQVGGVNRWTFERLIVLRETAAGLEAALTSKDYGLFTKILAGNRLAEYYPEQASTAFASASQGLRDGALLACMIDLAARMKTTTLQNHCRDLASDANVPAGIAKRAKAYLKAIEGEGKQAP